MYRLFLISCSLLVLNTYSENILISAITNIETSMQTTQQKIKGSQGQIDTIIADMVTTKQEVARKRGSFRVHSRHSIHDKPTNKVIIDDTNIEKHQARLSLERLTLAKLEKCLFLLQAQKNIICEVQSSPAFSDLSNKKCTKLLHSLNHPLSPLLHGYAETLQAQADVDKVPKILQSIPRLSQTAYEKFYVEYYFNPMHRLQQERRSGEVEILNKLLSIR